MGGIYYCVSMLQNKELSAQRLSSQYWHNKSFFESFATGRDV
jgi:hypothetical protein